MQRASNLPISTAMTRAAIFPNGGIRPTSRPAAQTFQRVEQRRAAVRIEMRHDLVEQQHRRKAGKPCDQFGVRENKPMSRAFCLVEASRGNRLMT